MICDSNYKIQKSEAGDSKEVEIHKLNDKEFFLKKK